MFSLLPRDTVFFDLLESLSGLALAAAEDFQQLVRHFPEITTDVEQIRRQEHEADEIEHQLRNRLDESFITPFDREDIHALGASLDSIVDTIRAIAKRVRVYHIQSIEPIFIQQVETLVSAARAVHDAVRLLRDRRDLKNLNTRIADVRRYENIGDENHLNAMSKLFQPPADAIRIIQWKELFEMIEQAINQCQDTTVVLERILLKNG
jgi:predicted phosphate transport protein (TIGR00153 family)